MLATTASVEGQSVSTYTFAQSTGTYTEITGGTVLVSGTNWNNQRYTVTLPTPFWFAGTWYSTVYVTANGYLTFGSMMANTNFKPMSSTAGYAGAIAPFGANLQDANQASSELRWQQISNEIVFQWRDAQRRVGGNNERFSFQARLNTANGKIRFVYSSVTNLNNSTAQQPEVGLRGANSTFPANVFNRTVGTGAENWATSVAGTSNASAMRFTSAAPAKSPTNGLTYIFSPPCVSASASIIGQVSCNGGQATVSVSGSGGPTPYSGTGSFLRTAGTHNFTVMDAFGCANITSVTVSEPPVLSSSATITAPVLCQGGMATVNVTASGGTTPYTGTGPLVRPAGGHSFLVTDANGCQHTSMLTISEPATLSATSAVVSVETGCATSDAVAVIGAVGGTGPYSGPGTYMGLTAGSAMFVVTDANGCVASTNLNIADPDTDSDGTIDCSDECPEDPNKSLTGDCGCGIPETDTDSDGTMDCTDGCPSDPAKVNPGACGCGVADTDSDGDTYADCVDGCPNDANKIGPGACGCGAPDVDSDGDGTLDCLDPCPSGPNPGQACDDGDPATSNDMVDALCNCTGTPANAPDPALVLQITTDAQGGQTSWEIAPLGGGPAVCSGNGLPSNSINDLPCAITAGNFVLRVMDSAGDGINSGGYVLRTTDGERIIDAAGSGDFGPMASQPAGFSLPLGTDRLTPSRCDREDLLPNDFIQAVPNDAVRAQFGENDANSGYQFWFFDPNGTYSRRVLITHSTASYLFPAGADRCSYLRLADVVTNPLPQNTLLNVRVRSRANGAYAAFGPACRLRIDLPGNCPTTSLVDDPNNDHHSCGISNVLLDGSRTLYAGAVSTANKYQWRFTSGAFVRQISTNGCSLLLTEWAESPLEYGGKNYQVQVRVSFDGGTNWCPWGATCMITTAFTPPADERMAIIVGSTPENLRIWPNPTRDGDVNVLLEGLAPDEEWAQIDMIDLQGRTITSTKLATPDGRLNVLLTSDVKMPTGTYLLTIRTMHRSWTERVVFE